VRILYIGHYKENSGWSKAAIDLILAMDSVGIDVTCRNIKLTSKSAKIPNRILELEKKPLNNIDICIQHVLPHHIVGTSKFKKNIACYIGESNTLKYNNWLSSLKLVDEIWLPNKTLINNFVKDGFDNSCLKYVPYAFDLSRYKNKTSARINFGEKNSTFKFYYIADLNERKNIESIIKCFHSEFHRYEPVSLVLKVKKFGIHPSELNKHVKDICDSIKKTLRIYPKVEDYHEEIIIPNDMTAEEIDALHNSCDCLVNTTHGEGWSIPAFDAMCFGKTPICGNEGGPKEFIKDKSSGTLISGVSGVCEHSDPAFNNIFTGRESWFVPDEEEVKSAMRYYYDNKDLIDRTRGLKDAEEFSYENVGNLIRGLLDVQ
jgi:glycosyltransferase involved in cell wall biosynthesis